MSRGSSGYRASAIRSIGGDRNAIRAEQLRALGCSDRYIARELGVDREVVARWFAHQDELVYVGDFGWRRVSQVKTSSRITTPLRKSECTDNEHESRIAFATATQSTADRASTTSVASTSEVPGVCQDLMP